MMAITPFKQSKPLPVPAGVPTISPFRDINGIKLFHSLDEDISIYDAPAFHERMFAILIDYFILGVSVTILRLPFLKMIEQANSSGQINKAVAIGLFLNALAFGLCQLGPIFIWGKTLGKLFFGIRVVTLNGEPKLTLGQVFIREVIGKFCSLFICGIGFLFPLWRADKSAMHDLMSETRVVKYRE